MSETRFVLVGTMVITMGLLAVVIHRDDHLRVAAAVAAVISLLATAFRPASEESLRWPKYIFAVTMLGALIVLAFFVLPHFFTHNQPKPMPTPKPSPTGKPTPVKKPKKEAENDH